VGDGADGRLKACTVYDETCVPKPYCTKKVNDGFSTGKAIQPMRFTYHQKVALVRL